MIKVVDTFLPDQEFFKIQEIICSNNFPFYYNDHITDEDDPVDYYYFIHLFFINNEPNSNYFNLWKSFLRNLLGFFFHIYQLILLRPSRGGLLLIYKVNK